MSDTAREIFVKNLKYFMELRGVSQSDICKALNVASATVSDWCNGKKYPRVDTIQHLADLLGVRFSTLTTENSPQDFEDHAVLEALHQNPKLRLLFNKQKALTDSDLDAVLGIVNAIKKERDGE